MKLNKLSILIKPASGQCNIACTYCFYIEETKTRQIENYGMMSLETAHKLIDECFFITHKSASISFNFQGGEPTLRGLDFFESFVDYVNFNKQDRKINYSIQTNGLKINQKWVDFFKSNEFLIGLSIDGYRSNHNHFRNLTYDYVLKSYKLLVEKDINVNVLTVLTNELSLNPEKYYEWLIKNEIDNVQLIPDLSGLKSRNFSNFYKKLFKLSRNEIKISLFENIEMILNNQYPIQCGMLGNCAMQNVIEANGNAYPCDFYSIDEYHLGNINEIHFEDIYRYQTKLHNFMDNDELPTVCHQCEVYSMCRGNCKKFRSLYISDEYCGYKDLLLTLLDREGI